MIFRAPALALLIGAGVVSADPFSDTLTVPSDSSGPFFPPSYFYRPNSITLNSNNPIPLWRFYSTDGSIRFETPVPAGTVLYFSADREFGSLKRTYFNLKPVQYDSAKMVITTHELTPHDGSGDQKVSVSGEKSVGINIGSGGEFSMDQTLDVQMFGKISDSTKLTANISDKSTSLEGDTKEVGEIDRIFLTLQHPRRDLTAGDLSIATDSTGLLREHKTPKGIGGGFKSQAGEIRGFAGITGHRFAVEYLKGIGGVQGGSYRLKGNGEPGQILPVEGSVELSVQGKKLTEGSSGDFTIDYNAGEIKFTPRFTVLDGDMIEIRYRYRERNYSKFSGGTSWKFNRDSVLTISTAVLIDSDNEQSSSTTLTKEEYDSLKTGGDSAPQILSGVKIHPNDVPKESARNRIYSLLPDRSGYHWEPSPVENALTTDLYLVTFTVADSGTYLPYNEIYRETLLRFYSSNYLDSAAKASGDSLYLQPVYFQVPKGQGTHTAIHTAPLPEQLVQGEIISRFAPSDQFSIETVIAGKARDRNTLSDRDDNDNTSGGFTGTVSLSTPTENRFTLSGKSDFSYAGNEFSSANASRFDLTQKWGIPADSVQFATVEQSVTMAEKSTGSITLGGGHAQKNRDPFSTITTGRVTLIPSKPISPFYSILYRFSDQYFAQPGRRHETGISIRYPKFESQIRLEEEWLARSAELSRGYLKGSTELKFPKIGLKVFVEQKNSASGNSNHIHAEEFATYSLWKQELTRTIRDKHTLNLTSSVLNQTGTEKDGISVLLSANKQSRYLDNRAATELLYMISSENSKARRWQYRFVGEGVGTHIRDSVTGEFLPAPFGDYLAEEIVLWGDGTKRTVQNGLNYRWSWTNRSRNRLSDGVTLEGALNSQEEILPAGEIGSALVPMVSTFSSITNDTVSYSQVSYSQQIGWRPPVLDGFSTGITSMVSRKEDLQSNIRHYDGSGSVRKEWDHFALENKLRGIMEKRNLLDIRDGSYEPLQEFPIRKLVTPFVEEILGRTSLEDTIGYYEAIRPGVRFTPKDFGSAELSYTVANLSYDGTVMYPMAKDFYPGINHRIYLTVNMNTKKYFHFTGFFRGDYTDQRDWRFMMSIRASVKF